MLCKKGVLENFTISFLMKFQASGLNLYWKRDSNTGVFLSIWWNFLRHLSLTNTYGYCFRTKGLFLQIFCKQKSFEHIVYNFTGLTSSNIRFCMTKSRVFIKKLFINPSYSSVTFLYPLKMSFWRFQGV